MIFKNAEKAYNYYYNKIVTKGKSFNNTKALFNIGFTIKYG